MQVATNEAIFTYESLDKDYGRVWIVGTGYGVVDEEQYKMLEEMAYC